jgi:hypothetical protein
MVDKLSMVATILMAGTMIFGCAREPEKFTCIDGSPLRLVDDRWLCEPERTANPVPFAAERNQRSYLHDSQLRQK